MRRSRVLLAVRHALDALRLPPDSTIVSALSGGADSVALLHALCAEARPRGLRVVAAHLDHRLRDDSADDVAACRRAVRVPGRAPAHRGGGRPGPRAP